MRALRALAALFATGCLAEPSTSPVTNFEHVWDQFDVLYGGFDVRGIDWDDTYDRYRPLIDEDSTDDELYEVLTGMLAELNDGHVMLTAPGREVFRADAVHRQKIDAETFDLELVRDTYLSEEHGDLEDDGYIWGMVAPGVAYVWFDWIYDNTYAIDPIADRPDVERVIVDLRHNEGGAYTYAIDAFGRVTDEEVEIFRTRTRNGPAHDDWTDWWTWTMKPRGEPFDGTVTVLTDPFSMSATERLILALQAVDGTVTIGVPSNGSQATMIGREAPNRWAYTLPVQEVTHPDGRVSEGVGIPVDIEIRNDPEVLAAGRDEVLEAAIHLSAE